MARTINYELKAQKIKGQIDELVTALHEVITGRSKSYFFSISMAGDSKTMK